MTRGRLGSDEPDSTRLGPIDWILRLCVSDTVAAISRGGLIKRGTTIFSAAQRMRLGLSNAA